MVPTSHLPPKLFGLVAFDKARDNNFVVRDEGTSPTKLINYWLALSLGSASFNVSWGE